MLKEVIGLVSVMIANILLGMTLAKLKKEFSKEKVKEGLVKYGCIIVGISLMYLCGYLNPNIITANIGGIDVNLVNGIDALFIAGIVFYGGQDLIKLRDLLGLKTEIFPSDEGRG